MDSPIAQPRSSFSPVTVLEIRRGVRRGRESHAARVARLCLAYGLTAVEVRLIMDVAADHIDPRGRVREDVWSL